MSNDQDLSYSTLETLWTQAGGPSDAAPTAAAIAIAESSGNPSAVQQGQPYATTGWGLWQITPGNSSLLDPIANAKAAVSKFVNAGNSFSPWTTYTGGQYRRYLNGQNYTGAGTTFGGGGSSGAIFEWQAPVIGTVDMDGLVGALAVGGGVLIGALGVLVLVAFAFRGPIRAAAMQTAAPLRVLNAVQQRSERGRERRDTRVRRHTSTERAEREAQAREAHMASVRRTRLARERAVTRHAQHRARISRAGARASEGKMVGFDEGRE